MSPTSNWSNFYRAYTHALLGNSPYANSIKGHAMPFFHAASCLDSPSVPLPYQLLFDVVLLLTRARH